MRKTNKITDLEHNEGKKVKIVGKVSNIMWQHMFAGHPSHFTENYIDLEGNCQIVVFSKKKITCKNKVEITGKVVIVRSDASNPNVKIHDEFHEYQIIADSWKCEEGN